ncbi:hypothetical protein Ctha_1008 [Chloroherpeton thalassium ATCC 35110]|uniref:HmuY family protein n=1 Tax=Chloroherpeton thalassium (strain ATCC 35110 / GB-78) TaxID=517418 RepID=B3QXU5_CHLT3|nr:HmuY family protein [Chloroherpeton thalassium]ACF13473.1 hypothetical protein Ctha_1008 [Chloroherpeton thalassium ATCC 35110]
MKKHLSFILAALLLIGTVGCDDDDDDAGSATTESESATMLIDATSYSHWVYFSFETGDSVQISDPKTSDEWDLAFMRYYLRTNSGSSGNALGGIYNAGKVELSSVTEAPESGYVVDDSISVVDHSTYTYTNIAASSELAGWMSFDTESMPPEPIYSDSIYVVKTGQGKYAKIHLKDYYGGDGTTSAMIEFDYVFQPDGSQTFTE